MSVRDFFVSLKEKWVKSACKSSCKCKETECRKCEKCKQCVKDCRCSGCGCGDKK